MKTKIFSYLMILIVGIVLTGCQHDDNKLQVQPEQTTGQYDKRVYELSDDPEVQAELQFMKDELGYDLSITHILQVGPRKGDYAEKYDREVLLISRKGVQMLMEEFNSTATGVQAK